MTWKCQYYPSGTTVVMLAGTENARKPHLYIHGPGGGDEGESDRIRYRVCEDVRDYLNGGERPKWLDDMKRWNEFGAYDIDGTSIYATGPFVDSDPPNLNWVIDDSDEASTARARLMDKLLFHNQGQGT